MAKQIRSERLRAKLLKIVDGRWAELQYLTFHLNNLVDAEPVCDWLISRGLTGENLFAWSLEKFGGMFIPMFDFIRAEAGHSTTGKAVLLGRDYRG